MTQISITVYSKELQKQIFPDNAFYKKSISETGLAITAKTFEIPNLTSINEAKDDDITILPLPVVKSDDSKVTGTMKLLYCDPILIENEEEIVMNYSKRQNKQLQQAAALNTKAADYAAYQWLPATANVISSTGAARATNVTGLSGNRKALTKADLLLVYNRLLRMNVKSVPGGLFGVLTPDGYTDLLAIADFVDYEKIGRSDLLAQGIIGKICGIEIMVRSKNGHIGAWYSAANAVRKAVDVAGTDRPANMFWHSGMVCHAESNVSTLINENDATYLGTIINSTVRFGAEKCREDAAGVVAIAEVA